MDEPLSPEIERLRAVVADVRAPAALRGRIATLRAQGTASRRLRLPRLAPALAAVAAVVVAVVVLSAGGGNPSVADAAALALRPPAAPAPAVDPRRPAVLRAAVGGVRFPSWRTMRWTPAGVRHDRLDGRAATTVFYEDGHGARLGYTIVDGPALSWPPGDAAVTHHGVEVHLARRGARRLAVWRVDGHTCLLSAPLAVPADELAELASGATYG